MQSFLANIENGVLKPVEPRSLPERGPVRVYFEEDSSVLPQSHAQALLTPEEWEKAGRSDVTLESVERALSSMTGSIADIISELRDER